MTCPRRTHSPPPPSAIRDSGALQECAQQQGADLRAAAVNTTTALLQGGEPGTGLDISSRGTSATCSGIPWLCSLLPTLTHRGSQVEFPKSPCAGPRAAKPNASANDIFPQACGSEERPSFSSESVLRLPEALCPKKGRDDPVDSQLQQSDQCKCWQKGSTVVQGAQERLAWVLQPLCSSLQRQEQRVLLLQLTPHPLLPFLSHGTAYRSCCSKRNHRGSKYPKTAYCCVQGQTF